MANTRLTVIVRKDLQMPVGLLAAQVSHLSDTFMREKILAALKESNDVMETYGVFPDFKEEDLEWMKEPYLSVLGVNSYEDLCEIKAHAEREELPLKEWHDLIPSPTFPDKSIRAFVGVAIGPEDFDKIKIVTGALDLY